MIVDDFVSLGRCIDSAHRVAVCSSDDYIFRYMVDVEEFKIAIGDYASIAPLKECVTAHFPAGAVPLKVHPIVHIAAVGKGGIDLRCVLEYTPFRGIANNSTVNFVRVSRPSLSVDYDSYV